MPRHNRSAARAPGTLLASLAAIGSILAASACCLPLLPFVSAAGAAGASAVFAPLRPLFLLISVLLILFGFYQTQRAKQCHNQPSPLHSLILWLSALVVGVSIVFPQVLANLLAG